MGKVSLIHDESWRAARLVVNHFEKHVDDVELLEAFHTVRLLIAESLRRCLDRSVRERQRLASKPEPENENG